MNVTNARTCILRFFELQSSLDFDQNRDHALLIYDGGVTKHFEKSRTLYLF